LYGLYDERIKRYEADPPPADWDGVFVATSK
jgi:adenylate cyclase